MTHFPRFASTVFLLKCKINIPKSITILSGIIHGWFPKNTHVHYQRNHKSAPYTCEKFEFQILIVLNETLMNGLEFIVGERSRTCQYIFFFFGSMSFVSRRELSLNIIFNRECHRVILFDHTSLRSAPLESEHPLRIRLKFR